MYGTNRLLKKWDRDPLMVSLSNHAAPFDELRVSGLSAAPTSLQLRVEGRFDDGRPMVEPGHGSQGLMPLRAGASLNIFLMAGSSSS